MSRKVFLTHPMLKEGLKDMEALGYEITMPDRKLPREEVLELAKSQPFEALIIPNMKADKEMIDAMPNLKIICTYGAGYDHVDVPYATEKGIVVANISAGQDVTSEYSMALIAATMRNIAQINHALRENPKLPWGPVANLGHTLRGKTLGIIGMGRIGRGVARLARAFGMNVIYHNRKSVGEELESLIGGAKNVPLEELLKTSDAVLINAPLTPETHHMISDKEIAMMKDDAYLFNMGRGKIVDEAALVRAMKNGKLSAAGLDVFETEPNINPELLALPNVVVSAHMGTATYEDKAAMVAAVGENIINLFEHEKVPHIVNKDVLSKIGLKEKA